MLITENSYSAGRSDVGWRLANGSGCVLACRVGWVEQHSGRGEYPPVRWCAGTLPIGQVMITKIRWHDLPHSRRAVYSPRSELSLARRSSSSASSVRRRLISRFTRVSCPGLLFADVTVAVPG